MRMPRRSEPLDKCESLEHPVQRHNNPIGQLSTPTCRLVSEAAAAGTYASRLARTRRCGASDSRDGVGSISIVSHLDRAQKPRLSVVHRQGLYHKHG